MADAYVRLDVQIPRDLLQRFMQGLRDLEQEAPDAIHMIIQVFDNDSSLKESEEMVRSLSPGFAYNQTIRKQ